MKYDASELASDEAWRKLHAISDEDFSAELLQEMAGACNSPEFLALLKSVREGVPLNIGLAFQEFAHAIMLKTVDGEQLAKDYEEGEREEAAEMRRQHWLDIERERTW